MPVLEGYESGLVEQDIDDDPLRRRKHHLIYESFVLEPPAVTTDQLHPGLVKANIENPRVGSVGEVETHNLPEVGRQFSGDVTTDEHGVTEPSHRHVRRLGSAERRDLTVFEQQVIEGEQLLTVHWGPIVWVRRDDDDVAVQPHLLAVVLPDVRVIPVQAGIVELQSIPETLTHLH